MSTLVAGDVWVFYGHTAELEDPVCLARCCELLSSEERAHSRGFHLHEDRLSYVAGHALLRSVLSRQVGSAPASLRFVRSRHGKPELASPALPRVRCNLSHTRGLVACAVTLTWDIGVDVEPLDPMPDWTALVPRVLSAPEQGALREVTGEEAGRRFVALWTLKEAYLKAVGLGLSVPPSAISVELAAEGPRLMSTGPVGGSPAGWRLHTYSIAPGYLLSLAYAPGDDGTEPNLTLRAVESLAQLAAT
jgi:4'-phosphopantetheinyl transferase